MPGPLLRHLRFAFLSAVLLVLGACTASSDPTTSTSTSLTVTTSATTVGPGSTVAESTTTSSKTAITTTTVMAVTTTTIRAPGDTASGSGCTPGTDTLPDGIWYGLVTVAGERALDFDLACWFDGDAAIAAAAEDGEESPPPNDYYTRNASHRIRSVPVPSDIPVKWYPMIGDPTSETTVTYAEWRTVRDGRELQLAVWLEVDGGTVVSIHEQWVP